MAILREFFLLLELRDRVSAIAETYQKKLIRRFKTAKEEGKLRGASPRMAQAELDKEQYLDAAKAIVNHFAESDPTKQNRYLDWIIRQFIKGYLLWEDSFKMRNLLTDFEKYRKKLDKKDLNMYDSYQDLEEVLEPLRGTEVAGVRVQNFLKKVEVQKFRDNMVADPTHASNKDGYEAIHGDDQGTVPDVPGWYEDSVRESASEWADDGIDLDDLIDEAKAELDDEDYRDEDGDLDEDAMQRDAEDMADNVHQARVDEYIDDYVREHAQSEWEQYYEENKESEAQSLSQSQHQTPELDVVYDNERLAVLIPNSKDAACFIGKGTEGCTGAEESDNYWWEYAQEAPLYVVVTDKLGKFQFHFQTSQYMDEHDRYIEDSDALVSLVKRYPKELERAFGRLADDNMEWWLLPIEKIPTDAWDQMLSQTSRGGGGQSEETIRDTVRVWQRHHLKAPEGWSDTIKMDILSGRFSEKAIKQGWFGKTEDHDMDAAIKAGLHYGTIQSIEQIARHVVDNNVEISPEAWRGLIMDNDNVIFYAPLELIDRELVDTLINRPKDSPRRGYSRTSFLGEFYPKFQELLSRAAAGPETKHRMPAHPWSGSGLERARKLAGMITMKDVIDAVLRYPDDLGRFKMDFGMKPWMAVANAVLTSDDDRDIGEFLHRIGTVVRQNEDEPWVKDLTNLMHQILVRHPEEAQSIARHPKGEMPLDTQNAILNHIASIENKRERVNAAQRFSHSIEGSHFSPETEETLRALRGYADPDEEEYQQLRRAVPAQQQLEM